MLADATVLASRLEETVRRIRAAPGAGQSTPTVTATLVDGHARVSSGTFAWETDLGPAIGGQDLAPTPTAYLLGSLAGCAVVFLRDTLAPLFGVTLADIAATARCRADAAGLLGVEGATPALEAIELSIRIASPDPTQRIEAMLAVWRERCPIYLALANVNPPSLNVAIEAAKGADSRSVQQKPMRTRKEVRNA